MGKQNVFFSFAFLARLCFAVFAISSPLAFANTWDGDKYIKVDSHATGKDVWVKNPNFGKPLKSGQAISKTATLQPQYKNKPLPSVPVTLSATPDAVKAGVKNLLRGGLVGVAITEGIGALFDGVDWLLDPANHTIQKRTEGERNYVEAAWNSGGFIASSPQAAVNLYLASRGAGHVCSVNFEQCNFNPRVVFWVGTDCSAPTLPTESARANNISCTSVNDFIFYDDAWVSPSESDLDDLVDNNYILHPNDISQLVAERSEGAFVKPNVVFIGDSPDGSVSLSQFPVSDVSNTETITIPHPNSSPTESTTINYSYDGKNFPVVVPPNPNNSQNFTMDIVKNITTSLDFTGTNQPAKSITYNSSTEQYELAEPLSDSDSPALNYTVVTNENYEVNGDTVYNSSTTTIYENDNEIVVQDSFFPPFCDWASVVCDFIDWFVEPPEPPEDGDFESLRPKNIPIPFLDTDILEADKNCPSPKEIIIGSLNTTLTFKYDQICSAVEAIRPFFLIICYISAARIVLRA